MRHSFDATIIGGGIVGLATAMKLCGTAPHLRVAVLEKENQVGFHQTGHNSGVIHSGIYYRPGSLKARMCIAGALELIRFCREHDVPYELCGKVVVAVTPEEIPRLNELHRRGTANGVPGMRLMDPLEVQALEPHVHCIRGLHVPTTGIVDFGRVAQAYAQVFQTRGGRLLLGFRLLGVDSKKDRLVLETSRGDIHTKMLINCAGLYSDRIARMAGMDPPCQIVPFRGEYYRIAPHASHRVRNLIYPVPDPRFPFLGVHFTRMIDGKVEAGPNAVLAWAREGYTKNCIAAADLLEILRYKGFWRLARRYWKPAGDEVIRSYSRTRFARALQQLIPTIGPQDLLPGGAGVRAQALGKDGALLDDFVILSRGRMVHVLNAPSPAATSALAIAEHILQTASPLLGSD